MDFSQFDRFSRYLIAAAILIAIATYWRFREIDLSVAYAYVAQHDVIRSTIFSNLSATRSIIWEFFGLINKLTMPGSVQLLRMIGLLVIVIDFVILFSMIGYILGQRLWGVLAVFLLALSPPAVVAAISGGPAAIAAVFVILFLFALYRNEYLFAGMLSAGALAAGLPGLIMFLIVVLDLLQNSSDRNKIVSKLLTTTGVFILVSAAIYFYSLYSGEAGPLTIPIGDRDIHWELSGAASLIALNILNLAGIVYLVFKDRFDVYRTHFHTFMMWVTLCALSIVQPTTLNIFSALCVSTVLVAFFMQGFASLWKLKSVSAGTFVFVLTVLFLGVDMFGNGRFLADKISQESFERSEAVNQVLEVVRPLKGVDRLVSNFEPEQLAVKLRRPVYEVRSNYLPIENFEGVATSTLYVASNTARPDTVLTGCRNLFTTTYSADGKEHFVEIVYCGGGK